MLQLLLVLFMMNPTRFEILPVESVVMPESYRVDSTSQIAVRYRRPTTCHIFNGFYYDINDFTRTVAIESLKLDQDNCTDATERIVRSSIGFPAKKTRKLYI